MSAPHLWIGAAIAASFLLVTGWGVVSWIRNVDPGSGFWKLLAAGQALLVLQVGFGAAMLFLKGGMHWLHYAYGAFPIVVLAVAHRVAPRFKGIEWAAFAVASFFVFGLQTRGLMTGLLGG